MYSSLYLSISEISWPMLWIWVGRETCLWNFTIIVILQNKLWFFCYTSWYQFPDMWKTTRVTHLYHTYVKFLKLLETGLSSLHLRSFGHILPHSVLDNKLWGEDKVYHVAWHVYAPSLHYYLGRTKIITLPSAMPLFHWIANERHWILGQSMYMKGSTTPLFPNQKFTFIWVGKRKSISKTKQKKRLAWTQHCHILGIFLLVPWNHYFYMLHKQDKSTLSHVDPLLHLKMFDYQNSRWFHQKCCQCRWSLLSFTELADTWKLALSFLFSFFLVTVLFFSIIQMLERLVFSTLHIDICQTY